ncbi:MAG TPA: hypothetical protein VF546_14685 [Pyrinomonadaceae bacterium]|jgi:hypothetical protein
MFTRRKFLRASAVAALFAGVPLRSSARAGAHAAAFPLPYASQLDPVYYLTKASFVPYLKSQFNAYAGEDGRALPLTLVGVSDLPRPRGADVRALAGREGFSLLFTSGGRKALPQATYRLKHAALGEFSLLIVPVSQGQAGGARYEAVVNRLYS